jgi:hypothetical protein
VTTSAGFVIVDGVAVVRVVVVAGVSFARVDVAVAVEAGVSFPAVDPNENAGLAASVVAVVLAVFAVVVVVVEVFKEKAGFAASVVAAEVLNENEAGFNASAGFAASVVAAVVLNEKEAGFDASAGFEASVVVAVVLNENEAGFDASAGFEASVVAAVVLNENEAGFDALNVEAEDLAVFAVAGVAKEKAGFEASADDVAVVVVVLVVEAGAAEKLNLDVSVDGVPNKAGFSAVLFPNPNEGFASAVVEVAAALPPPNVVGPALPVEEEKEKDGVVVGFVSAPLDGVDCWPNKPGFDASFPVAGLAKLNVDVAVEGWPKEADPKEGVAEVAVVDGWPKEGVVVVEEPKAPEPKVPVFPVEEGLPKLNEGAFAPPVLNENVGFWSDILRRGEGWVAKFDFDSIVKVKIKKWNEKNKKEST